MTAGYDFCLACGMPVPTDIAVPDLGAKDEESAVDEFLEYINRGDDDEEEDGDESDDSEDEDSDKDDEDGDEEDDDTDDDEEDDVDKCGATSPYTVYVSTARSLVVQCPIWETADLVHTSVNFSADQSRR